MPLAARRRSRGTEPRPPPNKLGRSAAGCSRARRPRLPGRPVHGPGRHREHTRRVSHVRRDATERRRSEVRAPDAVTCAGRGQDVAAEMATDLEKDLYIEMMMAESWKEIFGKYRYPCRPAVGTARCRY